MAIATRGFLRTSTGLAICESHARSGNFIVRELELAEIRSSTTTRLRCYFCRLDRESPSAASAHG